MTALDSTYLVRCRLKMTRLRQWLLALAIVAIGP
jgi:hypothetical protein